MLQATAPRSGMNRRRNPLKNLTSLSKQTEPPQLGVPCPERSWLRQRLSDRYRDYSRCAPRAHGSTNKIASFYLRLFTSNVGVGPLGALLDAMTGPSFWLLHAGPIGAAAAVLLSRGGLPAARSRRRWTRTPNQSIREWYLLQHRRGEKNTMG